MSYRILFAEDELATRHRIAAALCAAGFTVLAAEDGAEALERFENEPVDLVLSDHGMPRLDGLGLLRAVRRVRAVPFILYSASPEPEVVFRAGRSGALRFLHYPFGIADQLLPTIAQVLGRELRRPLRGAMRFTGSSAGARRVRAWIQRLGPTPASVLVLGETGSGKEVVARGLHEESGRTRLVSFAVTELAEGLLESELFGAERGAFTGAVQSRSGLLEQANGGTLFLDEIGDATPSLQAKLLRVLETGELRRVGAGAPRRIDVRVIAATHRDLPALVREGRFREDLFYRLAQARIVVPPLRQRHEDLEEIGASFLCEFAKRAGMLPPRTTPAFYAALQAHSWPGNARELRAVLQSALLWWDGHGPLEPADLLHAWAALPPGAPPEELDELQRMAEAFQRTGGNQEAARRELGLSRAAWRHRWRRFGLAVLAGGAE